MPAIHLTEEQEREALKRKRQEFATGLKELEARTGMRAIAVFNPSATKIEAVMTIIPAPEKPASALSKDPSTT